MTTNNIANYDGFTLINSVDDLSQKVHKLFASDLLSNVMAQTDHNDCLITMLNNINVIGVASLNELSCVIFTQGIIVKDELIKKANELNIPLFSTTFSTVETILVLDKLDAK